MTFKLIVGDRGRPFFAVLQTGDGTPVDLASSTATLTMKNEAGTSEVTAQSCTVHPTQTFTASATTDYCTANDHKVRHGDQLIVSTTTTLPTGLAAGTLPPTRSAWQQQQAARPSTSPQQEPERIASTSWAQSNTPGQPPTWIQQGTMAYSCKRR